MLAASLTSPRITDGMLSRAWREMISGERCQPRKMPSYVVSVTLSKNEGVNSASLLTSSISQS